MESGIEDGGSKKITFIIVIIAIAVVVVAAVSFVVHKIQEAETIICDPELDLPEGAEIPGYDREQNCRPASEIEEDK